MQFLPAVLMAACLATACAPTPRVVDPPSGNLGRAAAADVPAPAVAKAKRAPPRPGEPISPVIAFRGVAEHWGIQIDNAGGYAHSVELTWGSGSHRATGVLQYQPQPAAAAKAPIALSGSLDTGAGPRAIQVEIAAQPCTDDADQVHDHAVRVTVDGMPPMQGCGDLAM